MKKVVSYLSLIAGGLLLAASVQAQSGDLSYSYIGGGLTIIDPDGGDSEEGFNIRASASLSENFYFQGSWDRVEVGPFDVDIDNFKVGLGFHAPVSDTMDWFVEGGYARIETDFADDDGFRGDLGLRAGLNNNVEWRGFGGVVVSDDDETWILGTDFLFKITDTLGLFVGVESEEFDVFVYRGNLRLSF